MDGFTLLDFTANLLLLAQDPAMGAAEAAAETEENWGTYLYGLSFVLGIFVLPFVLSHFISKALRMPTISFRLGVVFAAIVAGLLFAWGNNFQIRLGPDMKGGTNLVYDIMPGEDGQTVDPGSLATALSDRINPSGTKEISIRPRGSDQIEITVPNTDEGELQRIKKYLSDSGQLEFRIVANSRDHKSIIALARQQAAESKVARSEVRGPDGQVVGRWYRVGREAKKQDGVFPLKTPVLGDIIRDSYSGKILEQNPGPGSDGVIPLNLNLDEDYALEKWMDRNGVRDVDVLMALETNGVPYTEVVGDDLASASVEFDKSGYVVAFRLNSLGANKMLELTAANRPDGNFRRRMAIIMDGKVLSAPELRSPISNSGQITGNFTKEEVEFLVTILRSGRLPATLSEEPVSENRVGAGLGATTIEKGKKASLWAIALTFVCILFYYRFAGVVASLALILNALLIFGIMIFIGQPLTLAGLAGLVLIIGMSVDANVLVFERIREEKTKGSTPRMSIRNGFDRALTTIIDANLTTLIAAIVLYWIGTDQVRGFAVSLVIGILTSMFTATFCSRVVFEIAEKLHMVSLSMADGVGFLRKQVFGDRVLEFMSWQKVCAVFSLLMIVVGIAAVTLRGSDMLNIDFMGGTSVTFQLNEPVQPDRLREMIESILPEDKEGKPVQFTLVSVEKGEENTVFTMVSSIDDEEFLSSQLASGLAGEDAANLKTYRVKILEPSSTKVGLAPQRPRAGKLISWQAADEPVVESDGSEASAEEQDSPESATDQSGEAESSSDAASGQSEATPSETVGTEGSPPQSDSAGEVTEAEDSADANESTASNDSDSDAGGGVAEVSDAEDSSVEDAASESAGQVTEQSSTPIPSPEFSEVVIQFGGSTDDNPLVADEDKGAKIDSYTLRANLASAAEQVGLGDIIDEEIVEVFPEPMPEDWLPDDIAGYSVWKVRLPVPEDQALQVVEQLQEDMADEPLWLSLSKIGSRVAGEMQQRAVAAILLSLVFIVAYIWFRFQKVEYGLAAVVALVHDVFITLGVMAVCHWLAGPLGFLLIEDFKIGLTEVAAFLTIIGYSLNDTIVVFDRIREVRGRSPRLTPDMINASINQTLSRTLLTSGTTLITVLLLYIFGGEGIHAFAFALLIGILIGTYSSIFVAAPTLLWLSNRSGADQSRATPAAA